MSGLPMWVVYDHPSDFPFLWVARLWDGPRPTAKVMTASDLLNLRLKIRLASPMLMRFTRAPDDDPAIAEVWL